MFQRRIWLVGLLLLCLPWSVLSAQGGYPVIAGDNLGQLTEIARLGRGTLYGIALSPDDHTLAVASSLGVWLVDLDAGEPSPILIEGHTGDVYAVAFNPEGNLLASGGADGTVRVWHAGDQHQVRLFEGHESAVRAIAFSPTESKLASGDESGAIHIWEVGGALEWPFIGSHEGAVNSLDFNDDGTVLLSGGDDEYLRFWSMEMMSRLGEVDVDADVESAAFGPAGFSYVLGTDQDLVVIAHPDREVFFELEEHEDSVTSVAYSPDGALVASAGRDGRLLLRDAERGVLVRPLLADDFMEQVLFDSTGSRLVGLGADHTVYVWDVTENAPTDVLPFSSGRMLGIAFSQDGRLLAGGSVGDDSVRVWETTNFTEIARLLDHQGPVRAIAISPDSRWLASGSAIDPDIRLWNLKTFELAETLSGHTYEVNALAFSPEGDWLASGGGMSDKTIRVWDASGDSPSWELLHVLDGHEDGILSLAFSPVEALLLVLDWDDMLGFWNPGTGEELAMVQIEDIRPLSIGLNPDATSIVFGHTEGARLNDVESFPDGTTAPPGYVSAGGRWAVFNPAGDVIALQSVDDLLMVAGLENSDWWATLGGRMVEAAFSPDGTLLAAAMSDGTVRIFAVVE